ncbi:hypothetical protein MHBO_000870, partial [Bonamia ostreae]
MIENYISEHKDICDKAKNQIGKAEGDENFLITKSKRKEFKKLYLQSKTLLKVIDFEFESLKENEREQHKKQVEECKKNYEGIYALWKYVKNKKEFETKNEKKYLDNENSEKDKLNKLERIHSDLLDIEHRGVSSFEGLRSNTDLIRKINFKTNALNLITGRATKLMNTISCREGILSSV